MSMLEAPAGDVAAYAADVRRALSDLTPEQVDDLTDDLEVALADAMADGHRESAGAGLPGLFGAPEDYANELRAAAGLAAPGVRVKKRRAVQDVVELADWARRQTEPLRAQPWWPSFASFMRSLAPLWWVLRGWVIYLIAFGAFFGASIPSVASLPFVAAAVVVSVQWGRGRWRSHRVTRWLWAATSAIALVMVLPLLATIGSSSDGGSSYSYEPAEQADGVYVEGRQVANLFVYDADGAPVAGAQVFDDQGRPIATTSEDFAYSYDTTDESDDPGSGLGLVPYAAADGSQRWNAFPLWTQREQSVDDPSVSGPVVEPMWPFARAGVVRSPGASAVPQPTPGASAPAGDPSTLATPTPGAAATPRPTPAASAPVAPGGPVESAPGPVGD